MMSILILDDFPSRNGTTTWHLHRQASLNPSPRSRKRASISEAPSMALELLKAAAPEDLVSPSGSSLLLPRGDEINVVIFNLESSSTSW